jgi:Protein of unknown function (DUF2877)
VRLNAAASRCLRSALAGPARPATWLGVTPAALYLRMPSAPGVVALLAHDAVRLPCALLLPSTAAEVPLTSIADGAASDATVGAGCVAWTGSAGPIVVRAVREWAPARVPTAPARVRRKPARSWAAADVLQALRAALPTTAALGIDGALLALLTSEPAAAVAGLLGRGPGLTPAGDDVLAGFVLGARAFGLDAAGVLAEVAATAPARTTAVSAALLWHAARGECVDEVAAVLADPSGPTVARLLRVGHTSGAALATGLSTAALRAEKAGEAA